MSKPYNPGTRCKKCDNQGANVKYTEATEGENWLVRTCRRCGYKWIEDCLDITDA